MSIQKLKFSSFGKSIDGVNYCSGVETLAENLMEDSEEDSVITFPSQEGWANTRTLDYVMTTDNVVALLHKPIYKLKSIKLLPLDYTVEISVRQDYTSQGDPVYKREVIGYQNFINDKGEHLEAIDIAPAVLTKTEWDTLSRAGGYGFTEYTKSKYKDNTFYYEQGGDSIPFLATVYKINADETPVFIRLMMYILYKYYSEYYYFKNNEKHYITSELGGYGDPRNWKVRIEYVPLTSKTKIRARKNTPGIVDYIQPYNQRAEINAVSALGKNMYLTAQKTGVREIKIVKNYTRLADIPPIGALVKHNGKRYRLVANTYNQTNTIFVQVTHTLSENWSSRANHLAVDQKYRNWKIPQDTLWRNLYWEDYVLISPELNTDIFYPKEQDKVSVSLDKVMQAFIVDKSADETIDTMYFIKGAYSDSLEGVYTACSTMPVGNSIVFAGQMQDNLSAGLRQNRNDISLCEEALYCNSDGTLENMCVILSNGVKGGIFNANNGITSDPLDENKDSVVAANMVWYPSVGSAILTDNQGNQQFYTINAPAKVVMHNNFNVKKDPGEAFKFTYQIHFIPDGGIIVGSKIAEHNPLIKRWDKNRKFRVWGLKHPIRDGVDIFVPHADEEYVEKADDSTRGTFTLTDRTQGLDGNPVFLMRIGIDLTDCIGWCITDENNNIYLASNDASITTVYFQMTHKRY